MSSYAEILDSPASLVTLLAPTDSGVQKTLAAAGLTAEGVLAQPELITQILTYHVRLPIDVSDSMTCRVLTAMYFQPSGAHPEVISQILTQLWPPTSSEHGNHVLFKDPQGFLTCILQLL